MKKGIGMLAMMALVSVLVVALVACGVPGNYKDGMEKMKGKGYDVNDVTTLSVSGSYLAFRASEGDERMTAVYFPKSTESKSAESFYAGTQKTSTTYVVKKTTAGNFIVVYFGTEGAVKDFEK